MRGALRPRPYRGGAELAGRVAAIEVGDEPGHERRVEDLAREAPARARERLDQRRGRRHARRCRRGVRVAPARRRGVAGRFGGSSIEPRQAPAPQRQRNTSSMSGGSAASRSIM